MAEGPARIHAAHPGGWQIAGVLRAHTGTPFNVGEPSSRSASRPDLVDSAPAIFDDYRSTLQYLNPAAFVAVPKSAVSGATRLRTWPS